MIVVFRFYVRYYENLPFLGRLTFSYLAAQTDKLTGTGLTVICQSACKITISEEIERDMERDMERERIKEENADGDDTMEGDDDDVDDSMPEICFRHFVSAVRMPENSYRIEIWFSMLLFHRLCSRVVRHTLDPEEEA